MKNYLVTQLIVITLLLLPHLTKGQDQVQAASSSKDKVTVGIGIGSEFSFVGVRAHYNLAQNLGVSASISFGDFIWNIGIDAQFSELLSERITPYVNLLFGINASVSLAANTNYVENKNYHGFTTGAGVRIHHKRKPLAFVLGASYRFVGSSNRRFVNDFNARFNSNISPIKFQKLIPTIGIEKRI